MDERKEIERGANYDQPHYASPAAWCAMMAYQLIEQAVIAEASLSFISAACIWSNVAGLIAPIDAHLGIYAFDNARDCAMAGIAARRTVAIASDTEN